jgi:hypothetical protein
MHWLLVTACLAVLAWHCQPVQGAPSGEHPRPCVMRHWRHVKLQPAVSRAFALQAQQRTVLLSMQAAAQTQTLPQSKTRPAA